jgi:anti-sigma-K factor RskA
MVTSPPGDGRLRWLGLAALAIAVVIALQAALISDQRTPLVIASVAIGLSGAVMLALSEMVRRRMRG